MHRQAHRLLLVFSVHMFYTYRHDAPNDQLAGRPARFRHEYDTSKGRSQLRRQMGEGHPGKRVQQEA